MDRYLRRKVYKVRLIASALALYKSPGYNGHGILKKANKPQRQKQRRDDKAIMINDGTDTDT